MTRARLIKLHLFRNSRPAFTLIELMVVVTLMTVAVGMAVFKMDGVADGARLRSAVSQIASVLRQAQTLAQTSGTPRRIAYAMGGDRIRVQAPRRQDGTWSWDEGLEYLTATGVHIRRVLIEGDRDDWCVEGECMIRIGPAGRFVAHAVVVELHRRWGVVVFEGVEQPQLIFLAREPEAVSLASLLVELEALRGSG